MLIAYDSNTGQVLGNTGTNSAFPYGPPDGLAQAWLVSVAGQGESVLTTRLHDQADAALIAQLATCRYHVDPATGTVVIDSPHPELTASSDTVPADNTSLVTVTYTDAARTDPVVFTVNGAASAPISMTDGAAEVDVQASALGPIVVTCEGLSVTITGVAP